MQRHQQSCPLEPEVVVAHVNMVELEMGEADAADDFEDEWDNDSDRAVCPDPALVKTSLPCDCSTTSAFFMHTCLLPAAHIAHLP